MNKMWTRNQKPIDDGSKGLNQIIQNSYFTELVNRYELSEDCKNRLKDMVFEDYPPYFFTKRHLSAQPSGELKSVFFGGMSDLSTKWFLLLYSISSASNLFVSRIVDYCDKDISLRWQTEKHKELFNLEPEEEIIISQIVGSAIENNTNTKLLYQDDFFTHWDDFRQGFSKFALTAGYHYTHDSEVVPVEILERNAFLPFSLSCAMYISYLTGMDFYEALQIVLKDMKAEGSIDDVIAMVQKNIAIEQENKRLSLEIAEKEEKERQQEINRDIISDSIASGMSKIAIDERVKKCNDSNHRLLLKDLESTFDTKLSYIDSINTKTDSKSQIEQFLSKYNIVFSEKEYQKLKTIEDLIDNILVHQQFIDELKMAVMHNGQIEPISENDPYDLESRIKEAELVLDMKISNEEIKDLDSLLSYISRENKVLKGLVEVIAEQLKIEPNKVEFDSNLFEDLGMDSLDSIELLLNAEKEFGISISDEKLETIRTVEDAYKVVKKNLE